MPGYHGMAPAPYAVVVERKTAGKVRAQRKAFSRTTVIALSLIGIAALCHKYTYRGNYQDLADAPAKADGGMDEVAVKAIEVDMKKEEKKVETGLKENWVGMTEAMAVILAAEIGDKSFFVAIILAMKYDKWLVLFSSMIALSLMSISSAIFGGLISQIDHNLLQWGAAVTYLVFGGMMLWDAYQMDEEGGNMAEAREELEEEGLVEKEAEGGLIKPEGQAEEAHGEVKQHLDPWKVIWKVFMLMFVAEMGDRTMIAMIVLSTRHDPVFVCVGSILGFLVVTLVAVLAGHYPAGTETARLATTGGGGLFILFAIFTFLQASKVIQSDL